MALNIPYASTFIVDYMWMGTLVWFCYAFAADEKLNAWTGAVCVLYVAFVNITREHCYWIFLKPYFAKIKTDFRLARRPDYIIDILCTTAIVTAIGAVTTYYGIMHCRFEGLLSTIVAVSRDYWMINLIKDNTSMRFIHPWMHKKENYWIHKRHHMGNRNLTLLHAFVFDIGDLTIEFSVGSLLAMTVNYALFGDPSLHLLSFMFSIWTDGNIHSENPYTQAIGNPILDAIFKLNICHNLHHAFETDQKYMVVYPYHHLSAAQRTADVERYNKLMKTDVDFRILI